MTDFVEASIVRRFQRAELFLHDRGFKVSVLDRGFYSHNNKGTIVADVQTVDALMGFLQGIEYGEAIAKGDVDDTKTS
jgi:hypothetical protein